MRWRCALIRIVLLLSVFTLVKGGADTSDDTYGEDEGGQQTDDTASTDREEQVQLEQELHDAEQPLDASSEPLSVVDEDSVTDSETENVTDAEGAANSDVQRWPNCEDGHCDSPLDCFDFGTLGEDSVVPDPPSVLRVAPLELEGILENASIANCCALVMFYAPWCEFSAQFARTFNALGRTFASLPVLAVDLGENEPYKYVLAYLPVVVFYYRGRVILKFKLSATYEELKEVIANLTGFVPREIELGDAENEQPVPTEREDSDRVLLLLASWWLGFVMVVLVLKSRWVAGCVHYIRSRLAKTEKVD